MTNITIEGLEEIKNAICDLQNWHEEFNKSFEGEGAVGGLGVRSKPTTDIEALKQKYPRAAAYLKAENYSFSSNYAKASAGKKAMDRIANGEDYVTAISEMEQEFSSYCDKHLWD